MPAPPDRFESYESATCSDPETISSIMAEVAKRRLGKACELVSLTPQYLRGACDDAAGKKCERQNHAELVRVVHQARETVRGLQSRGTTDTFRNLPVVKLRFLSSQFVFELILTSDLSRLDIQLAYPYSPRFTHNGYL